MKPEFCRCCSCCLILGCLLYFPIQYSIYYPYFNYDWESSTCKVSSIKYFITVEVNTDTGETSETYYSLLNVKVNISGHWMQGFACGCSDSTSPSATKVINESYPYQYSVCKDDDFCGNMLMMPSWFCAECKICTEFLNHKERNCKYTMKNAHNGIDSAIKIPIGYKLDYPTEHSTFIQIIFTDSPFYYKSDYLALQIICFWIMIIVPGACIVLYIINRSLFYIKKRGHNINPNAMS